MTEKRTRTLSPVARQRSRELRRNMTKTEQILWNCLRKRSFENWKFARQCPIGPYFADFVCRKAKLIVELDGEGHDLGFAHDQRRDAFLREKGYSVLRIPAEEMLHNPDGVLAQIAQALAEARS
ncbi:MAG: endonuclease domain-containing protein [Reyranellaceae bacterium]